MKRLINYSLVLLLVLTGLTLAQNKDYSSEAGYLDFGNMSELEDGEMVAEVIIEEHLLKMVSKLTKNEDQELSDLLNGLKLVRVHAFDVTDANTKMISDKMEAINKQLGSQNWDRIVRFRDKDESGNVYIKTDQSDNIVGLVVLAMDKKGEAAFVNIVGKIDLETIGRLSDKFDVPGLEKVNGEKGNK